jgi:hypothetical protein
VPALIRCSYCDGQGPSEIPPPDDHWLSTHAVTELGKVRFLAAKGLLEPWEIETARSWEDHPARERRDRARALREGLAMAERERRRRLR